MNDVWFPEPVTLKFLTGPRNVAECLDQQWPKWARGRSWRTAVRACRDALDGWCSARDAHKAFLEAVRRARPVPSATRSLRKSRPAQTVGSPRPEMNFSGWR
jgi:hypothetical protein